MEKHRFRPDHSATRGPIPRCDVPGCGKLMSDPIHHTFEAEEVLPATVPRITRDMMLIQFAELARQRSTCLRGQVGVVIAINGRVASIGYNGSPPGMPHCTDVGCEPEDGCERTIHAEANAIAWAARHGIAITGGTMYSTHSPCRACAQLIVSCGIAKFVYVRNYRAERLDILEDGKVKVVQYGVAG